MIGRLIWMVTLFSLAGCVPMQQQQGAEIVQQANAQLGAILQTCLQRMQSDRDLDSIRAKVELIRTAITGAPPPSILNDQSRPTSEERVAITKWGSMREACAQEQIRYGLSLSLPANLQPSRDRLVVAGREANQQTGLLVGALYDGRLTYGQFAAERMKNGDRLMGSFTSATSRPNPAQPSFVSSPPAAPSAGRDEIALERKGGGYLVPVVVNGLPPINFLLDTGSDVVALPAEVVFTLWRTGSLRSSDFIGNRTFVLADGRRLPSPTFRIRELRVGQHVIPDAVGSLNPALTEPLLGGSFLSRFASWSIDNQRNALVLSR